MSYRYSYFLSFSSKDIHYTRALDKWLTRECRRCWFDRQGIEASRHFPTAISNAISQSRQIIALVSAHSLQSKWFNAEIWSVLRQDPTNESGRVIPVSLDGSRLPGILAEIQDIDASNGISQEVIDRILDARPVQSSDLSIFGIETAPTELPV